MNIIENLAMQNLGVDIDDENEREVWKIENDNSAGELHEKN